MPQLDQIVVKMNASLKAGTLASERFQPGSFNGIARIVTEKIGENDVGRPCIVTNEGECTDMTPDDQIELRIYHRIVSLAYAEVTEDQFGDGEAVLQETAEMIMIIQADRNVVQLTPENLVAGVIVDVKKALTTAELAALQLKQATIEMSSADIDQEKVWASEYSNSPYALKPNYILCSVPYRIITVYDKNCFNLCTVEA